MATTRRKPGPKPKLNEQESLESVPAAPVYKFNQRATVVIASSGEQGQVRARAEWATGNISYYVAYVSKNGEHREAWIDEELLTGFIERRKK